MKVKAGGEQVTMGARVALLWRRGRRGGLGRTLLIAFLPMVIGPLITLAIIGVFFLLQTAETQVSNQLELVATLKEQEISRWLRERDRDLAVLVSEPLFQQEAVRLLDEASTETERLAAYSNLGIRLNSFLERKVSFAELFLLDAGNGQTVVSTDVLQEGISHGNAYYFQQGLQEPFLQPPEFDRRLNVPTLLLARPMSAQDGQVVGVIVGRVNLGDLSVLMLERTGLGETGETYLVGQDFQPVTRLRFGQAGQRVDTVGAREALKQHKAASRLYDNYQGTSVFGVYRWIPDLQVALLAEQSEKETLAEVWAVLWLILGITIGGGLLAALIVVLISRRITRPITRLTEAATEMASGDLSRRVAIVRQDEIGTLSQAFDGMAGQLEGLIGSLEQRVADRTRDLERRSAYLEASAGVSHAATSILEADRLLSQVVELIRDRFGLYYVGLFLLDESGQWAVLRAGTGEAGRAMLRRGHRLQVGGTSMIGWSIANAQARIALDVGEDAVHLATAELPDTRSEGAVPLRLRGEVIGALTVQSDQPDAFDEAAIVVLQTMADQVAVALDNARLFAESQAALEAMRRAYGELSREAWADLLRVQPDLGYRSDERGVTSAGDMWRPEMERALQEGQTVQGDEADAEAKLPLAVPIKVRGDVIGVLDTYKPDQAGDWTPEEVALLEEITEQVALALDSARLYQDTQRRAARERLIRRITDRIRDTVDIEGILQTTVQEVGRALGVSHGLVRLGTEMELGTEIESLSPGEDSVPPA